MFGGGDNMAIEDYEDERFSLCCFALPLFDLHIDDGIEPSGICSYCKENTTFAKINEEEDK